ncbi:Rad50/SbcC-type AAA domain [Trypanosoma melophagium]|uniref:Rad50/SbcC-type AAA domain n=1 Tax=Trypanosoma melophagium TaxID=715481 RepID=UPI00351A2C06|nr:Rad50/SbcC-type AAA domain [Trypanosoma melophagium]
MTSIEQIEISGVRSFDPNPAHRQRIVFQKPLTVILGKNGAGKTTIIEALLNACTGQMPPGSGSEKSSFIYDPKVMGETDVKAQIRLLFTGRGGKVMQVIRSFQALRARSKTTFATLDNTVAYQDPQTGKVVSNTYRASDVDRAVPEMLGVSPAVLEHVIFCHQEDGNWPLAPPKDVKKIFDDIFAATRYVLALDRLRENSKEFRRQQKEHEANLMALREHRDQAEQLTRDITAKEESIKTIQLRAKSLEPQLKKLHTVAAALSSVEQNAENLSREAAIIQGRIEERQQSVNRANLPLPTQTLEEFLELKRGFAEHVNKLETEALQKSKLLEQVEEKWHRYEEEVANLRTTIHFFEQQEKQHAQNCTILREIVNDVAKDFVLKENDIINESTLQRITDHVNKELQNSIQERESLLKEIDAKSKLVEEEQTAALRTMDADNKEKEMKEEQLKHIQERINETQEALRKLQPHANTTQLETLQKTIHGLEERVKAVEELKKKGENYKQRHDILQKLETQNRIVAELRQQLSRHKQLSTGEAEMNLLRAQIEEKQKRLDTGLQETVIPALSIFGYDVTDGSTLAQVSLLTEKLRDQRAESLRIIHVEHGEIDRQIAVLQQKQSQLMNDIVRNDSELQRKRNICTEVLGNGVNVDQFETILHNAREALQNASHRSHALEAMTMCYANFVEVAKIEKKCPVCDREFSDDKALTSFVDLNKVQQQTSPENVEKARLETMEAQEKVRRLEAIETHVHDVRRIVSNSPGLKQSLSSLNDELANKKALLEDVERKREVMEDQMKNVQEIVRGVTDLNAIAGEMYSLRQHLLRRESSMKEIQTVTLTNEANNVKDSSKTYEELSAEYENANAELYRLNVLLNEVQRREDGESDQAAANELSVKRAEYYQLEMKLIRQGELEEVLTRCRKESDGYRERIATIDRKRIELQVQLNNFNDLLNKIQQERQETENASKQGRLGKIEESLRMLSNILPKVRDYIVSQHGEQVLMTREKLYTAEVASAAASDEVKQLRTSIQEARSVVDKQYQHAAEMEKQIDILEKLKWITEDQARLKEIEKTLADLKKKELFGVEEVLGSDVVAREIVPRIRELIRSKVSELERSRAQQEGNMEAMLQDVVRLKSQLAQEKYKDVEKRYRSTFLRVQTTEIAVADIEKYYRALEKAVQSYHQEKIAQVNHILADLWRQTYKGSDIDTVELRSEDDATSTTTRRSYSYRVVMKRGNSEMDMRGRCSAGQKVLAAVLIRLALSEAFCCDCGILALDEPTTNLDEDNARSLAESLRLLIDNHRSVKHFQLIVITHDEQFVRALGGQALDTFYYIHKDREGAFSVIEERTFDQLFAA